MHYFENSKIKEINKVEINFKDRIFHMETANNVFSKGKLDFGTKLLLNNFILNGLNVTVLDYGCGYGVVGVIINKLYNLDVDMLDITDQAVRLSTINVRNNKCNNVSVYNRKNFNEEKKYNYVLTNPPIKSGKQKLYLFVKEGYEKLLPGGIYLIVIRKNNGALSLIKDFQNDINFEVIDKDKGFYILKAIKN